VLREREKLTKKAHSPPSRCARARNRGSSRNGASRVAEEPLAAEHGRQLGFEHFDGDGSAVLQVFGEKDDRYPSLTKLSFDPISIAEGRRELLLEFHGRAVPLGRECVRCGPAGRGSPGGSVRDREEPGGDHRTARSAGSRLWRRSARGRRRRGTVLGLEQIRHVLQGID